MSKLHIFLRFVVSLALPLFAGFIGSLFTFSSVATWYVDLNKPALTPPSWIFGPVWTTLYILMGISLFLVWNYGLNKKEVRVGIVLFGVQLFLNTVWSLIFFGAKNPGAAFIEIVLLWASILGTIILFSKVSKTAGALLVPYIVWVSFAAYLNYGIWILN